MSISYTFYDTEEDFLMHAFESDDAVCIVEDYSWGYTPDGIGFFWYDSQAELEAEHG